MLGFLSSGKVCRLYCMYICDLVSGKNSSWCLTCVVFLRATWWDFSNRRAKHWHKTNSPKFRMEGPCQNGMEPNVTSTTLHSGQGYREQFGWWGLCSRSVRKPRFHAGPRTHSLFLQAPACSYIFCGFGCLDSIKCFLLKDVKRHNL